MFNVGPGEILLISVVALLLLGPDKLPELARGMGKFFREFRKHTDDVRGMVEREFYKMDQDVLQDVSKKETPAISPVSADSNFGLPLSEGGGVEPHILPPPSFPAFPAPEGVVPSRPVPVEGLSAEAPQPDATEPSSSDAIPRSDQVVPGREV
jgi:sec-independent protein translocase protein TatB